MLLRDAVGVNCENGANTDIMEHEPTACIWAKRCISDNCASVM